MSFADKTLSFLESVYPFLSKTKEKTIKMLKANFEVRSSKTFKIVGLCFASALFVVVLFLHKQFLNSNFGNRWLTLAVALILPMIIGLSIAYTVKIKHETFNKAFHFIGLFIMPFFAIAMTEAFNSVVFFEMKALAVLGNYIIILLLYLVIFGISGSFRVVFLTINTILCGFAIAHCYIMEFRGQPLVPSDLWSIGTAGAVADAYDFTPKAEMIIGLELLIMLTVWALKTKTPKFSIPTRIVSRVVTGTISFVLIASYFTTTFWIDLGFKPYFWNMHRWYKEYGFVYNFFCNARYITMPEPPGYDSDKVGDQVDNVNDKSEDEYQASEKNPNIICIMNESLSDLQILGDFETNVDYMPYLRSLSENTIKGYTYVPVIGAGTSNTEFEFLTGHSTAFLPAQSNAYMLYIKDPLASMTSTLKAQNYSAKAFHPYYAKGWDRTKVYGLFGFEDFISFEDMVDAELYDFYEDNSYSPNILQQYVDANYPELSDMFIRQYVSDSYNFEYIINDYKNSDKSKPYFMFNVTMQNHGGYTAVADNFEENVHTTSLSTDYPKVNQYLSLVKQTDTAFKELVEYFSKVKEPTVICMFGDHHPTVEKEFIEEVMGVKDISNLSIRQNQLRHATPFYIWANYDIEEQYIDAISVNYLSSIVLKTAGVQLTEYNKYLLELAKELPVIDTVGYIDKDGRHYAWDDKSPYSDLLYDYERVQYNNLRDQAHVDTKVFYLEGYVHTATELSEEEE